MPFVYTGLDYLRPFCVIGNWTSLFTCVAVKAVNLEVVDMTSEQFFMALRRFISRPKEIILDNVNQFKPTKSTINRAWKKASKG